MKSVFILFLLMALFTPVFAQKPDSVLARVRYTYISKADSSADSKPRKENMLLFLGKNASVYTSYDRIIHETIEDRKFRAMMAASANGSPKAYIVDNTATAWMSASTNLYFSGEDRFYTREVIALNNYIYEEKPAKINWKISHDTLTFSGLRCQKATGTLEGKNFVAWFAPGLQFKTGPWKLNGLPGLIVEAYDDQKSLQFQFAGFEQAKDFNNERDTGGASDPKKGSVAAIFQMIGMDAGLAYFENVIKFPANAVKIEQSQMEKLKAAFKKDPKGFTKALSGF
ncbi:GLPGLI family protein [Pedobacter metabolipauper]|uniref:GLPGLI family protein n=1 Tax=Pedobacter metabolipauper TaxID=425513 RepID=A0A4R6STN6_9SPHI|nr:GLPGLI family protein [Pedobacter metabolipauper]TDQ07396.1 GLPGLI family protein [Pedobacter metabolipauper]